MHNGVVVMIRGGSALPMAPVSKNIKDRLLNADTFPEGM